MGEGCRYGGKKEKERKAKEKKEKERRKERNLVPTSSLTGDVSVWTAGKSEGRKEGRKKKERGKRVSYGERCENEGEETRREETNLLLKKEREKRRGENATRKPETKRKGNEVNDEFE